MGRIVQIPIRDGGDDAVIDIDTDSLPAGEEVLGILRQERAPLSTWIDVAVGYHSAGKYEDFVKLLETSGGEAMLDYPEIEKDQMRALDTLAAYYVREGHIQRGNRDRRKECFQKATLLYTTADKIQMYEQNHLLGRAYFCLLEGNKIDQADQQFNFVINTAPDNIPATLGKACIHFQKKDYKTALALYKKALKLKPECPADIRLGIGHCLVRMGKIEKARLAFERCLELDPVNVSAMAALAILDNNTQTPDGVRDAIRRLSYAYNTEPSHPIVLNHLANHFFFREDLEKVEKLAWHAFQLADTDAVRAESCFQLARCYHFQQNYEKAFRYYYQSAQIASAAFVLPQFGLGQMYIQRQEYENAIGCFEKILKQQPNNAETLKIIGSLYAHIDSPKDHPKEKAERKQKAREMLTKLLALWPDDVEALIDLAQLTENSDPSKSLTYYEQAVKLLTEREGIEVPPEMHNNMGSLYLNTGKYEKAKIFFEEALERLEVDIRSGDADASCAVTMRYNLARSLEMLCMYEDAERIYKDILRSSPSYIDCYMRLGCLMRDRGQIYESSVWFKEGCSVDQQNADAWTLMGNLHMAKHEWGPAQKKFEQIMKLQSNKDDAFSVIALGNVWLETLFSQNRNKEKDKQHADRAIQYFSKALKVQPKNMWAANGIGCVLAFRGYVVEARDIFSQVREATAEFLDVWINIAHIYMEQKQYVNSVQMYSSAMKRFNRENDVNLLVYLARAYFKAGKLEECRETLEKAVSEQPDNLLVKFNQAFVLQKLATLHLKDDKATLEQVMGAVDDLKTAERIFSWLSSNRDETFSQSRSVSKTVSGEQARACTDLLCQAQQYVLRAQRQDETDQQLRRKQEEEREALRQRILAERREREQEELARKEELVNQRKMYMQMTKDLLRMPEVPTEERKARGGGGGRRKKKGEEGGEFVNDSSDMGYSAGEGGGEGGEGGERKKKKGGSKKRREKRARSGSDEEDEGDREDRRRKKKEKQRDKADQKLSAKQSAKIKSRAFLSSESESSDGAPPPERHLSGGEESPPPPAFDDSDDSANSDADASSSRPKKKKAVMSDESDSDLSNKSDAKPGKESDEDGSQGGANSAKSDSDSD